MYTPYTPRASYQHIEVAHAETARLSRGTARVHQYNATTFTQSVKIFIAALGNAAPAAAAATPPKQMHL